MKRLPFLDWTRGLAVVIMIQCHVFNSFARVDLRQGDAYVLSQFIGGMAAVLFLFLAGVTLAFQMDSAERREPCRGRRFVMALRRAGYIFVLSALFRLSNWACAVPWAPWWTMLKVDILNCMALAMAVLAFTAVIPGAARARAASAAGIVIAAASPLVHLPGSTGLLASYIEPSYKAFAFFPWAAYVAFGIAVGTMLKRTAPERMDRVQQWSVLAGFGLIAGGQHFANNPLSLYPHTEFWLNSPALIFIRTGIVLVLMAGAYLWTERIAAPRWSWVQTLGKTSLMAYWVHIMLVYGLPGHPFKKALPVAGAALAAVVVTALMAGLAAAKLHLLPRARQAWAERWTPEPAETRCAIPEDELEPVS